MVQLKVCLSFVQHEIGCLARILQTREDAYFLLFFLLNSEEALSPRLSRDVFTCGKSLRKKVNSGYIKREKTLENEIQKVGLHLLA